MKYFLPGSIVSLSRTWLFTSRIADVGARGVGVPVEAELRVLVVEARGGIELVEDVAPLVRGIERGVDDGEIAHLPDHLQIAQPLLVCVGEMLRASS